MCSVQQKVILDEVVVYNQNCKSILLLGLRVAYIAYATT